MYYYNIFIKTILIYYLNILSQGNIITTYNKNIKIKIKIK